MPLWDQAEYEEPSAYQIERIKEEEQKMKKAQQNSEDNKYGWAGLPPVGE